MPIPKPEQGETKDDFMARCMGDENMQEYDEDQRAAICATQWEEKDKKAVVRAIGHVLRAPANGSRVVRFRASTFDQDRHGTKINPAGIVTANFDKNPVFLWGHDGYGGFCPPEPENVIGRVISYERTPAAFDVDVEFADHDRAEFVFQLVKGGFLNTVSVGIIPLKYHYEEQPGGGRIEVYDESELLEVSLVPIPSNPQALALVRSIARGERILETAREIETRIGRVLSAKNEGRIRQIDESAEGMRKAAESLRALAKEILAELEKESEEKSTPPAAQAADSGVIEAVRCAVDRWVFGERLRSAVRKAVK